MSQSVRAIAPAIAIVDGAPTTTSLQVAQHFGKQHEDVLKRIRVLTAETPAEFNAGNFAAVEYTDAKGERRPPTASPATASRCWPWASPAKRR